MRPLIFTNAIYTILFYLAYFAWCIPEILAGRTQKAPTSAKKQDRHSMAILLASLLVGAFLSPALVWIVPSATITWQSVPLFFIGLIVTLLGIALRQYAIRVLGRYFTRDVATQHDQQVIQSGPYQFIRHPAYSGTMITVLGLGLMMTNWISLLVIMLGFFIGHAYRIFVEEQALCAELGQPYVEYMQRTKRLIPFIF